MILKLLMLGIWMVFVPLGTGYFALSVSGTIGWKNGTGSKNGGMSGMLSGLAIF